MRGWLKSKTLVWEESLPPPSLCRRRGGGGGGASGDVLLPSLFCINQIMTLKSLQSAAVTTSKLRSPGLFTGSKPGNNGHRFSPEDAERKKKKKKKKMPRLIVTLHGAFVRGSAVPLWLSAALEGFSLIQISFMCCLLTMFWVFGSSLIRLPFGHQEKERFTARTHFWSDYLMWTFWSDTSPKKKFYQSAFGFNSNFKQWPLVSFF